ncbi:SsgA family sporulation/cell division regulator [Streptomyces sp. WAC06614]|uniref:SsgA family sporulation/cell division regulator n=1 Tax=Streptomyces sp. WAC06614 TaxID=2487416 RepID=UPI000F7AEA1A|nr:SsgA family sporulation/cell division regulator [Streptomyces sp. WAC06614]RSS67314.1 SsgA family sporulation/cell division regulator [Streptomyces sp. WAC06614]
MSLRREGSMDPLVPTVTPVGAADEDLDFEALLDASSLGAPHVRGVLGQTPEPFRRRIAAAAAGAAVGADGPVPGEEERTGQEPAVVEVAQVADGELVDVPGTGELEPRRAGAAVRREPVRTPDLRYAFAHRSFLIYLSVTGRLGGTRHDPPVLAPAERYGQGTGGGLPRGLRSWRERDGEYEVLRADVLARLYEDPADGALLRLTVRLTYRPSDPYAVEAVFRSGPDRVAWVFARELLVEGLRARAGAGDVTVWSDDTDVRKEARRTFIELSPPEGTALVALPSGEVAQFLDESERIVAFGAEDEHLMRRLDELEEEFSQLTASPGSKD